MGASLGVDKDLQLARMVLVASVELGTLPATAVPVASVDLGTLPATVVLVATVELGTQPEAGHRSLEAVR